MVLEKAKRMVECGHRRGDIPRFDNASGACLQLGAALASGKVLSEVSTPMRCTSPSVSSVLRETPRRRVSLTIIATALIDARRWTRLSSGVRRGTGMELQRTAASNKRVYPAVDVISSGTRREDLLLTPGGDDRTWVLRKYFSEMTTVEAMEFLQKQMSLTETNEGKPRHDEPVNRNKH